MFSYISQPLFHSSPEMLNELQYQGNQPPMDLQSMPIQEVLNSCDDKPSYRHGDNNTSMLEYSVNPSQHYLDTTTQIQLQISREQEHSPTDFTEICAAQEFVWTEVNQADHVGQGLNLTPETGHEKYNSNYSAMFSYLTAASKNPLLVEAALTDTEAETSGYSNKKSPPPYEIMNAPSSPEIHTGNENYEIIHAQNGQSLPVGEIIHAQKRTSCPTITYGIPISSTPIHSLYPALLVSLDRPESDYHLTPVAFRSSLIVRHIQENIDLFQSNNKLCSYLNQLLRKYQSCSKDIESERLGMQRPSSHGLDESLDQYYENLHHSLLDRVEKSLRKLYAKHGQQQVPEYINYHQLKGKCDRDQVLIERQLGRDHTGYQEKVNNNNNINKMEIVQDFQTPEVILNGGQKKNPEYVRTRLVFESPENMENLIPETDEGDASKPPKVMLKCEAVKVMDTWFNCHRGYPYPCSREVRAIAGEAGISPQQVRKWFANRRIRTGFTKKAGCGRGKRASGVRGEGEVSHRDENNMTWKRNLMRVEPSRPIRL